MYWFTGKNSKLNMGNILLIYKTIVKPIWTYGIALWGMAAKNHIGKMGALQSITLKTIVNVPWYVRNEQIQSDLSIKSVEQEIKYLRNRYMTKLGNHPNELANNLYSEDLPRRLHRKHPNDLLTSI